MAFNPELGSTSPAVLLDNAERLDKLVNGPAADVPDRGGDPLYSWRQMMAKNDEIRQNIIPLSKQYMTIEAAQADIATTLRTLRRSVRWRLPTGRQGENILITRQAVTARQQRIFSTK